MNVQQLIEKYEEDIHDNSILGNKQEVERLKKFLADLQSLESAKEQGPRWVKASERLPDNITNVIWRYIKHPLITYNCPASENHLFLKEKMEWLDEFQPIASEGKGEEREVIQGTYDHAVLLMKTLLPEDEFGKSSDAEMLFDCLTELKDAALRASQPLPKEGRTSKCGCIHDDEVCGLCFKSKGYEVVDGKLTKKEGKTAEEILLKHYGRSNQPFTDVQREANKHILKAMEEYRNQ